MRKLIVTYLVFFLFVAIKANPEELYLKDPVFQSGEVAKFNIYFNWGWIWIHAGDVVFSVQTKKLNGEKVYSLKVVGYSTRTFDKMYRIRDTFEAFVDTADLLPFYYQEVKHEDSYYCNKKFFYQRESDSTSVYLDFTRKKDRHKDTVKIDNHTFDLITTCYKIRSLNPKNISQNQTIPFPMLFDDEIFDLGLTYNGKETIKLRNGKKYKALKFTPKLITGNLFKKEEDMTIYVSDDENHVPLLIEAKIKVGSIKAMLVDVKNTKNPMTSQIVK